MHLMSWLPSQPANGQHKSHMKIDFFSKKNAVGHMTFARQLTILARQIVCALFMLEL